MGINLIKGQKVAIGQTNISLGLGWTPNQGTGHDYDLDCSVFMLGANKLVPAPDFFIFFNNPNSPDGAVKHSGDDTTGGNSTGGDDETVMIDTTKLDPRVEEMLVVVTIHDAMARGQNFGQVHNSYIRAIDNNTGEEIFKFDLGEDFSIETAVEFGRLYKKDGAWRFDATGIGYREDLAHFVSKYYDGPVTK
jgi:tellurium resistance protein TerD